MDNKFLVGEGDFLSLTYFSAILIICKNRLRKTFDILLWLPDCYVAIHPLHRNQMNELLAFDKRKKKKKLSHEKSWEVVAESSGV